MIPTWVVLTPFAAIGVAYLVLSRIAKRREDRKFTAEFAELVREFASEERQP